MHGPAGISPTINYSRVLQNRPPVAVHFLCVMSTFIQRFIQHSSQTSASLADIMFVSVCMSAGVQGPAAEHGGGSCAEGAAAGHRGDHRYRHGASAAADDCL